MNYAYDSDDDDNISMIDLNSKPRKTRASEVKICSLPQEQNAFIESSDEDAPNEEEDMCDLSVRRGYQIEGKQKKKEINSSSVGYKRAAFTYDSSDDDENESNDTHYRKPTSELRQEAVNVKAPVRNVQPTENRPRQQQPQTSSVANDKSNRFVITLVSKRARNGEKPHPWEHRITDTDMCFAVNGVRGKTLFLRRGNTYYFEIKQKPDRNGHLNQYLYFTTDPMGGVAGEHTDNPSYDPAPMDGAPDPTANGVVCYKVTSKTPKLFYYQSKTFQMLGGPIVVKD